MERLSNWLYPVPIDTPRFKKQLNALKALEQEALAPATTDTERRVKASAAAKFTKELQKCQEAISKAEDRLLSKLTAINISPSDYESYAFDLDQIQECAAILMPLKTPGIKATINSKIQTIQAQLQLCYKLYHFEKTTPLMDKQWTKFSPSERHRITEFSKVLFDRMGSSATQVHQKYLLLAYKKSPDPEKAILRIQEFMLKLKGLSNPPSEAQQEDFFKEAISLVTIPDGFPTDKVYPWNLLIDIYEKMVHAEIEHNVPSSARKEALKMVDGNLQLLCRLYRSNPENYIKFLQSRCMIPGTVTTISPPDHSDTTLTKLQSLFKTDPAMEPLVTEWMRKVLPPFAEWSAFPEKIRTEFAECNRQVEARASHAMSKQSFLALWQSLPDFHKAQITEFFKTAGDFPEIFAMLMRKCIDSSSALQMQRYTKHVQNWAEKEFDPFQAYPDLRAYLSKVDALEASYPIIRNNPSVLSTNTLNGIQRLEESFTDENRIAHRILLNKLLERNPNIINTPEKVERMIRNPKLLDLVGDLLANEMLINHRFDPLFSSLARLEYTYLNYETLRPLLQNPSASLLIESLSHMPSDKANVHLKTLLKMVKLYSEESMALMEKTCRYPEQFWDLLGLLDKDDAEEFNLTMFIVDYRPTSPTDLTIERILNLCRNGEKDLALEIVENRAQDMHGLLDLLQANYVQDTKKILELGLHSPLGKKLCQQAHSKNGPIIRKILNLPEGDPIRKLALRMDDIGNLAPLFILQAKTRSPELIAETMRILHMSNAARSPEEKMFLDAITSGHYELAKILKNPELRLASFPPNLNFSMRLEALTSADAKAKLLQFAMDLKALSQLDNPITIHLLDFAQEALLNRNQTKGLEKLARLQFLMAQDPLFFSKISSGDGTLLLADRSIFKKYFEEVLNTFLNKYTASDATHTETRFSIAIAEAALTASGGLNQSLLPLILEHPACRLEKLPPPYVGHLKKVLFYLQTNPFFNHRIGQTDPPKRGSHAEFLIRKTLELPEGSLLGKRNSQVVILSALMSNVRQQPTLGSCFATAYLISQTHSPNGLEQIMEDLISFCKNDKIVRIQHIPGRTPITYDYPLVTVREDFPSRFPGTNLLMSGYELTMASIQQESEVTPYAKVFDPFKNISEAGTQIILDHFLASPPPEAAQFALIKKTIREAMLDVMNRATRHIFSVNFPEAITNSRETWIVVTQPEGIPLFQNEGATRILLQDALNHGFAKAEELFSRYKKPTAKAPLIEETTISLPEVQKAFIKYSGGSLVKNVVGYQCDPFTREITPRVTNPLEAFRPVVTSATDTIIEEEEQVIPTRLVSCSARDHAFNAHFSELAKIFLYDKNGLEKVTKTLKAEAIALGNKPVDPDIKSQLIKKIFTHIFPLPPEEYLQLIVKETRDCHTFLELCTRICEIDALQYGPGRKNKLGEAFDLAAKAILKQEVAPFICGYTNYDKFDLFGFTCLLPDFTLRQIYADTKTRAYTFEYIDEDEVISVTTSTQSTPIS